MLSEGLYDPLSSAASHKLSSATGADSSSHEGISGQERVPFAGEAITLEPGGVAIPMPGDDSGSFDRSERPQTMSASDQGKRPGLTRGRSHSGSSRRPGGRPTIQSQSAHYPPSNPQESIHHLPGSPVGFQGSQYQGSTSSPYDHRANYGGQYTVPSQSPMSMGHTSSPYPYALGFHPGSLHGPQDPNMLTPSVHPGYPQMLQPHGPLYPPYQRHSPENASSSHSFPGGYSHSHVTPSPPPISSVSAQSPIPVGNPQSTSFCSPGQFHSLQFSGTISSTPYSPYTSQPFPSAPIYQSQYAPSPYPQSLSPPTSDSEGQGTWWYLPHPVPPHSRPFEGVQPSYQSHYPVGYSHMGRRDGDISYSPTGPRPPAHPASTPTMIFPPAPVRHGAQQGSRSEQAPPSSSAANERASPVLTDPAESGVSATALQKPATEHVIIRRHYHPNPPAQRSEWVMWAGNVPSDTVHDELWRFFKQPPSRSSTRSASPVRGFSNDTDDSLYDGVSSIFLISRSNCAFVNFDTEAHLNNAIKRFNGKPLRPNDTRCPRLVCRVRRKDDDLKAGVGGQRGMGIHTRWIKEKAPKVIVDDTSTPSTSETASSADQLGPVMAAMSISSDEERSTARKKQSSSGSYASTNSSILTRYFPKRYFILKSLTQVC
jgi:hypothetical protein